MTRPLKIPLKVNNIENQDSNNIDDVTDKIQLDEEGKPFKIISIDRSNLKNQIPPETSSSNKNPVINKSQKTPLIKFLETVIKVIRNRRKKKEIFFFILFYLFSFLFKK